MTAAFFDGYDDDDGDNDDNANDANSLVACALLLRHCYWMRVSSTAPSFCRLLEKTMLPLSRG